MKHPWRVWVQQQYVWITIKSDHVDISRVPLTDGPNVCEDILKIIDTRTPRIPKKSMLQPEQIEVR